MAKFTGRVFLVVGKGLTMRTIYPKCGLKLIWPKVTMLFGGIFTLLWICYWPKKKKEKERKKDRDGERKKMEKKEWTFLTKKKRSGPSVNILLFGTNQQIKSKNIKLSNIVFKMIGTLVHLIKSWSMSNGNVITLELLGTCVRQVGFGPHNAYQIPNSLKANIMKCELYMQKRHLIKYKI